jgi:hypothetical protein
MKETKFEKLKDENIDIKKHQYLRLVFLNSIGLKY